MISAQWGFPPSVAPRSDAGPPLGIALMLVGQGWLMRVMHWGGAPFARAVVPLEHCRAGLPYAWSKGVRTHGAGACVRMVWGCPHAWCSCPCTQVPRLPHAASRPNLCGCHTGWGVNCCFGRRQAASARPGGGWARKVHLGWSLYGKAVPRCACFSTSGWVWTKGALCAQEEQKKRIP